MTNNKDNNIKITRTAYNKFLSRLKQLKDDFYDKIAKIKESKDQKAIEGVRGEIKNI